MINVGSKIEKLSKLPFKCGLKVVTVDSFIEHPITKNEAVVVLEDKTIVEIRKIREVI